MLLLDLSNCGPAGLLRVLYFFKLILDIVFIIIPIALIILLIVDFAKAVISGDEAAQLKTFKIATKRIFYAIIVFFVPTIVNIFNVVLGDLGVEYSACYTDLNLEAINELEAEEIAVEQAGIAALLAKQKQNAEMDTDGFYVVKSSECDGMVYYENGIFYKPDSSYVNGVPKTMGSAAYGYNKYFYNMLLTMINDASKEGYTIKMSTSEYGAWRPYDNQKYFWDCYQTKSCNNGNPAAKPGTSNHGWGIASDLKYSKGAEAWAHANAKYYGLHFSVCKSYPNNCSEPWHIAPINVKTDNGVVRKCG